MITCKFSKYFDTNNALIMCVLLVQFQFIPKAVHIIDYTIMIIHNVQVYILPSFPCFSGCSSGTVYKLFPGVTLQPYQL